MKKLKLTDYGLLPIYLSDLNFLQEGLQEQIEALIKPWIDYTTADSFIITGIEPNPLIENGYTSGWVVLDGKLYYVDAFISEPPLNHDNHRRWVIDENYLPTGTKIPKRTNIPVETHIVETAKVEMLPASDNTGYAFDLPRMADIIKSILNPSLYSRSGEGTNGSYKLQFLQLAHKYVHVTGTIWPKIEILSDTNLSCEIAVSVPFILDTSFKNTFNYEAVINIYGTNAMEGELNPHTVVGCHKGKITFHQSQPFTFKIYAEEISTDLYSSNCQAGISVNIILKIK